ncbi:cytochrome c biogenesis CcdA family protein [Paeniglutamicibacter psychrophenolicus]|uniref:Cytochrome c biogenesis protein CcdA n=1 Tax=Paeniglutamicibacter psychrophenolicus TaxID=257454 RepID=A0ABS4W7P4_9MICC|nr:cytochrome c biogenesis protein CcdA [Paeniglutamicibacter psychrophenolicus]MBP2372211.1 cytochrome c biogenesis protein CcdA [Paeniglutamicibacter psychrophenolicus]
MDIGLGYALIGGMLGVFSPCNALLLPALFATISTSRARLLSLGAVFLAGLLLTLVPLGLGLGWLGGTIVLDRGLLLAGAGWVLIALGVLTAFGGGIDFARFLAGKPRPVAGSLAGTFALGAVSGVAGFCTGPVLGAILTLALTSASPARGGTLLGLYGVGMVLPIMLIAMAIRRLGHRSVGWMRGRLLKVGRLRLHTTSLLMGAVTAAVGWLMIFTNGMAAVPELLPSSMIAAMENLGRQLDAVVPSWAWTALVGALLLFWWLRAAVRRTGGNAPSGTSRTSAAREAPREGNVFKER